MPEFFLVDRSGTCEPNREMALQPSLYGFQHQNAAPFETSDEIAALLHELFPNGLSLHGQRYLFERTLLPNGYSINHLVELIVELIRRLEFGDLPSRFESFFAWETLDAARAFKQRSCQPFNMIVRVEAELGFRADMELLRLGVSLPSAINLARKYWSGISSPTPVWEVLLRPPIRILERIEPVA